MRTVSYRRVLAWTVAATAATAILVASVGCDTPQSNGGAGGNGGQTGAGGSDGGTATLFQKYGAALPAVIDDVTAVLLADCEVAPYFSVVGMPGHDSIARLKSCLVLQFTVVMGGPGVYPGTNAEGDMCETMQMIHTGLDIPQDAFDKFMVDLAAVLKQDGVTDADTATIVAALTPLSTQIVSPTPVEKSSCDGGAADGPITDGAPADGGNGGNGG